MSRTVRVGVCRGAPPEDKLLSLDWLMVLDDEVSKRQHGTGRVMSVSDGRARMVRSDGIGLLLVRALRRNESADALHHADRGVRQLLGDMPDPVIVIASERKLSGNVESDILVARQQGRVIVVLGPRVTYGELLAKGTAKVVRVELGEGVEASAAIEEVTL